MKTLVIIAISLFFSLFTNAQIATMKEKITKELSKMGTNERTNWPILIEKDSTVCLENDSIFSFPNRIYVWDVKEKMDSLGYRPATADELAIYGQTNDFSKFDFYLYATGDIFPVDIFGNKSHVVPCLEKRGLCCYLWFCVGGTDNKFLGIKK